VTGIKLTGWVEIVGVESAYLLMENIVSGDGKHYSSTSHL
jgi:hypothetical protein